MPEQELLSLSEASARYDIPISTLRVAAQRGDLDARKIGNQWVVEAQVVEHFIRHRPKPGPKTSKKD